MNLVWLGLLGAGAFWTLASEPAQAARPPMPAKTEQPRMKYFQPSEFGTWWPDMSPDLLRKLDDFRERWGYPVEVSSHPDSRGRVLDPGATSQHNVTRWGEVRAVDVFPMVPDEGGGYRYMATESERERAYQVARAVGFTGIGLYTDTTPGNMLHVDVRGGRLAQWSRVNGNYLGIEGVLA